MTTYNTPGSVFDNPMPEGANDESYYGNNELIPPAGSVVMIRIDFGEPVQRDILVPPEEGHRPDGAAGGGAPPGAEPGGREEPGEAPGRQPPPGDEEVDPSQPEDGKKE